MIEDKEKYRNECSKRYNQIQELIEKKTFIAELVNEFGDASITDISLLIEENLENAQKDYDDFRREETETLNKINEKYDCGQILDWIADGYDTLDMVNFYLSGQLKPEMTQEKFDEIFLDMLRKANKVVWIKSNGGNSDIPTCNFEPRNAENEWMFDIRMDSENPRFWCSYYRVYKVFNEQYGLELGDIQCLMKHQLKRLFNMDGVAPQLAEDNMDDTNKR